VNSRSMNLNLNRLISLELLPLILFLLPTKTLSVTFRVLGLGFFVRILMLDFVVFMRIYKFV
jgi:hypothetical protein